METSPVVSCEALEGIALVTVDNPPVNALSAAVRAGLLSAITAAAGDPAIAAIVIACAGRTFIAGADISEFDMPPQPPVLPDVIAAIEAAGKPMVAAIHGSALGGGFEVALGASHRVALAGARVGLPETRLGLIPGAGGTQRLPALIGAEAAARMIVSGAPVTAAEALALGAIDRVIEGDDLRGAALAFARELAERPGGVLRPPRIADVEGERRALDAIRAEEAARSPDQIAWRHALDAIETGLVEGRTAGLAAERAAFLALRGSPQAKALREAFFAARKARSGA